VSSPTESGTSALVAELERGDRSALERRSSVVYAEWRAIDGDSRVARARVSRELEPERSR